MPSLGAIKIIRDNLIMNWEGAATGGHQILCEGGKGLANMSRDTKNLCFVFWPVFGRHVSRII